MIFSEASQLLTESVANGNTETLELDLDGLSDGELILLLTRFSRNTCPIIRGVTQAQRTRLIEIMETLASRTM